jgi:hypothetical protein
MRWATAQIAERNCLQEQDRAYNCKTQPLLVGLGAELSITL